VTDLSPAAQAVLDAITDVSPAPADESAAAALRAAADQVVPEKCMSRAEELISGPVRKAIRRQLLAIAAELESQ
jgi:hypothetical protein